MNVTDYNLDDAVEFTTVKKYIFRPELSHGLTGDEIVTTLHPRKRPRPSELSITLNYSSLHFEF